MPNLSTLSTQHSTNPMPYYRRNVYVLSIAIFLAAMSWNQVVPFLPLFLKELGVKGNLLHWVGIVFAAQSAASIVALPFWGKLGDRYGQKPMVLRAGICLVGIYLGMSFCTTPWQLAVFRFLNGALTGFIPGSLALIAVNTPQDLAPRYTARAQSASAAGMIVGPAMGGLLAALVGYRGSMQISGAAVLVSTLLVWRLVKEPIKAVSSERTSLAEDFAASVRSPLLSSLMLTVMLNTFFVAAINPMLAIHLGKMNGGAPAWLTGVIYSMPAAAFLLSAQLWTRFGERWGYKQGIAVGFVGGAVASPILAVAHNVWLFGGLFFAAGAFLAAMTPSAAAITCTQVQESFRGRAYGMQQSATMFGALLAPLAAARVGSAYGIPAIFVMVGGVFVIGLVAFRTLSGRWGQPEPPRAQTKIVGEA